MSATRSPRDLILGYLQNADGGFVSSSELCAVLNTSRTAVWKHVRTLVAQGYSIEASPHRGYRLTERTDSVTSRELGDLLTTRVLGRRIEYSDTIDSTNQAALRLAEAGVEEGTVVLADRQTSGRGRMGREWVTPQRTGIQMSLILRPPLPVAAAAMLTLFAAVAAATALERLVDERVAIKWPNDLVLTGKKLGGILIEASSEGNSLRYAVVGIGINANSDASMFPASLREKVISLREAAGRPIRRVEVIAAVLALLEEWYYASVTRGDFADLLDDAKARSATIGHLVAVDTGIGVLKGVAEDIAADGALLLRRNDQSTTRVYSGDIVSAGIIDPRGK